MFDARLPMKLWRSLPYSPTNSLLKCVQHYFPPGIEHCCYEPWHEIKYDVQIDELMGIDNRGNREMIMEAALKECGKDMSDLVTRRDQELKVRAVHGTKNCLYRVKAEPPRSTDFT